MGGGDGEGMGGSDGGGGNGYTRQSNKDIQQDYKDVIFR